MDKDKDKEKDKDKTLKQKKYKEPIEIIKAPRECIKSELVLPQFKSMCEEIICSICLDVVWDPISCGKCTSPFGKSCINKWFQLKQNKCPKNCTSFEKSEFSLILKRMINKIEFNCLYKSVGCKEVILYENFYDHVNSCYYASYKCVYPGCDQVGIKKVVSEHSKSCKFFIGHCQKCRFLLNRSDFELHKDNKNNSCFEKCLITIDKLISQNEELKKENKELALKVSTSSKPPEVFYCGKKMRDAEKFPAIAKFLSDKKCAHDFLFYDYTNEDWDINCDVCKKDKVKISLGCRNCNIDFCLNCFNPVLTDPILCEKGHILQLTYFKNSNVTIECTPCKKPIVTDYIFECKECKFSSCFKCYKKCLRKSKDCVIY